MSRPRSVSRLLLLLAVTIGLGLGSRRPEWGWPDLVRAHAGDALWTVAVYGSLALVFRRAAPARLFAAALAISLVVELSQLLSFPWLDALRSTLPGRLLLGQGWQWGDLPRYAAGAVLAWAIDRALLARSVLDEAVHPVG